MSERTTSLLNPRLLPSRQRIKEIADRAAGIETPAPTFASYGAEEAVALSKRKRKSSSPRGRTVGPTPTRLSESAPSDGETRPRPGAKTGIDGPGGAAPTPKGRSRPSASRKVRPP